MRDLVNLDLLANRPRRLRFLEISGLQRTLQFIQVYKFTNN